MSRTALIASLVAFAALALIAWLAVRPGPRQESAARPLQFDPARVERVEIDDPNQPFVQALARDEIDGWRLTLAPRSGDSDATVWPLAPNHVRTALRALAEASIAPTLEEPPSLGEDPLRVVLTLRSGASLELEISPRAVGGKRLARVDGQTGLIDDAIHELLTTPGPRAWRSRAALAGAGADTAAVSIERGAARVELRRMRGVWRLTQPVQAPADPAVVGAVIDAMIGLRVEAFEDAPAPADLTAARMETPEAVVVVGREVRRRDEQGEVRTQLVERTLTLGAPADLERRTRFARAGDASPLLIVADGGATDALSADVSRYLRRSATLTRPENVGMATISTIQGQRGYRRDASGWSALSADGAATPADGEAVQQLLSFLADRIARSVSLAPPTGYESQGEITLYDFADGPLETVEFGRADDGALVLRTDAVHRTYAGAWPKLLAEIEPAAR